MIFHFIKCGKKFDTDSRGFTIIELLAVVAIISVLTAVVLANMGVARAKSRDARKMADLQAISTALHLYFEANGHMPTDFNPCCGAGEGDGFYEQSMGQLVSGGFLGNVPKSPGNGIYYYYDYGPGNDIGALVVTSLENVPDTTTGYAGSCRPWAPAQNWCSQLSDKEYCICNPY